MGVEILFLVFCLDLLCKIAGIIGPQLLKFIQPPAYETKGYTHTNRTQNTTFKFFRGSHRLNHDNKSWKIASPWLLVCSWVFYVLILRLESNIEWGSPIMHLFKIIEILNKFKIFKYHGIRKFSNISILPEPIIWPITMNFRWLFLERCNRLRLLPAK